MEQDNLPSKGSQKQNPLASLVNKVSPETVNNIINTTLEIIRTNRTLKAEEKRFLQDLELLKENNQFKTEHLKMLTKVIIEAPLSEEQRDKFISKLLQDI